MSVLRNSKIAILAMILMIVGGTLVGSHNSLMEIREDTSAIFTMGVRGDGIGIQGDLNERSAAAYNMVVIARKYLPEENALIQNVLSARLALGSSDSVREKARANRALDTAVKDLFDVLNGMTLAEQDARYPQRLYTDFRSRGDTISHDPYNQEAAAFNRTLSGFPAGFLGGLTGVKPLEIFD